MHIKGPDKPGDCYNCVFERFEISHSGYRYLGCAATNTGLKLADKLGWQMIQDQCPFWTDKQIVVDIPDPK